MSLDFVKDDGVFLPMLNDIGRNTFYQQALLAQAPGKVVCDIGAGTGFLSVLAVQAGAKQVIAVEKDLQRYNYLNQTLEQAGYKSRIQTVHADFVDTDIAADVYVSETLNTQIFGEGVLALSNHVVGRGQFIPGSIKIWAEVYGDHPIFILDFSFSEAYDFDPQIDIDRHFINQVNQSFRQQYDLDNTVFKANQLNRLFTMLPHFQDVKLQKLYGGMPVVVNLNQYNDQNTIELTIPNSNELPDHAVVVIKWEIACGDVVLSSDQCWFGNVAKPIRNKFKTKSTIQFCYDPAIANWRLDY